MFTVVELPESFQEVTSAVNSGRGA